MQSFSIHYPLVPGTSQPPLSHLPSSLPVSYDSLMPLFNMGSSTYIVPWVLAHPYFHLGLRIHVFYLGLRTHIFILFYLGFKYPYFNWVYASAFFIWVYAPIFFIWVYAPVFFIWVYAPVFFIWVYAPVFLLGFMYPYFYWVYAPVFFIWVYAPVFFIWVYAPVFYWVYAPTFFILFLGLCTRICYLGLHTFNYFFLGLCTHIFCFLGCYIPIIFHPCGSSPLPGSTGSHTHNFSSGTVLPLPYPLYL